MKNSTQLRLLVAAIMLCACVQFAVPAEADMIGMNFTATRFGGGPYPILPHESAGFVPQVNWNNSNPVGNGTEADVSGPIPGKLSDDSGVDSGASIVWSNANAEVNSDGGNTTPDERLFRGLIEGTSSTSPSAQLAFEVSNIPYEHYDVYAYLARFSFGNTASAKIGSEEYFFEPTTNFTVDGYVRATATTVAGTSLASYALFEDLTGDSFVLNVIKQSGNRAGLAGLQIVNRGSSVPEPSTYVMGVLALAGLGCCHAWKNGRTRRRGFAA